MSRSESDREGLRIKMTRDNYLTWKELIKDFILALDHDDAADIWQAFIWVASPGDQDDPADKDYQDATNAPAKKLRVQHNKAFKFIRSSLSRPVFDTTVGVETSVPKLLRHLRAYWNDGTVTDRDSLRMDYLGLQLDNFDDFEAYTTAFKNQVRTMREHKLGMVHADEDVLFQFNKSLPPAWSVHKGISTATGHTFLQALSYYRNMAKSDSSLPGALKPKDIKAKVVYNISSTTDSISTETCRNFARGKCQRGSSCKYAHPAQPDAGSGGSTPSTKCGYCDKIGHKLADCWKKKKDEKRDEKPDADSTHAAAEQTTAAVGEVSIDGVAFMTTDHIRTTCDVAVNFNTDEVKAKLAAHHISGEGRRLVMVLDGASTVGIIQDESLCTNVTDVDTHIKTGGEGKPTLVHCKRQGFLPIDNTVDGRRVQMLLPVKIIPGFGVDVIPECFFLKKGYGINKLGPKAEIRTPNGMVVLRANALCHDNSWLFYVSLNCAADKLPSRQAMLVQNQERRKQQQQRQAAASTLATSAVVTSYDVSQAYFQCETLPYGELPPNIHYTHVLTADVGERECEALLPIWSKNFERCYAARPQTDVVKQIQLWHKRKGHENNKEVASSLQMALPANMPPCLSCLKAKSKRQPLTGGGDPIHDGIRPGYAWACDHAGPFPLKTWGGNNLFSLKVDVHSGKLAPKMTNSTGTFHEEWTSHVLRLEAHFGKQMVAQMITDFAPYFEDRKTARFNSSKGIIHVRSPPYTQELNGLVERTLGTLLAMTRTSLDFSGAPERSFGECIMAMCYTLDRRHHRQGGRLTRLEKWYGRLLPRQHDRLRVWGCAAYCHLDYGGRGKIGNVGKLDPRAELFMLVGYDPNGMGYRIASLPGFKIRTSVHLTFVEDFFPCRTTVPKQVQTFMTPDQQDRAEHHAQQDSKQDERPRREWHPSPEALEHLAAGDAAPPDVNFIEKLGDVHPFYFDTVFATTTCPSSIPKALAGSEALAWSKSLDSEVTQHEKNETFGPAIDPKDLPPGIKAIPFDCVLAEKRDGRKKVRGIVKGFRMTQGLDYNETFAPVPCISILRFFFALAAKLDWEIKQGDVNTAFLCAEMDAVVYVAVPNWFMVGANGSETGYTIRQLRKGVPGIPQGSRLFHKKSHKIYTGPEIHLIQCKSEFCLYFCAKRCIYLIVWVDDIFIFFPTAATKEATAIWTHLQTQLDLDEWQDIDDCLACIVRRDRANRVLWLTQQPAIEKLLLRNNLLEAKDKDTPMTAGLKLSKKQCPSAEQAAVMAALQHWYRSVAASLIYIMNWTRPDIAFAVSKLCKFMQNPGNDHIMALKRLLRYVKATKDYGLKFDFSPASLHAKCGVYGYYDASHADCLDTLKSTMAHVFFFFGCPLSWHTKLHTYITTSTNHSEYCAAAKAAREAKWWDTTLVQIGFGRFVGPIDLFSDSMGAIAMTYNPVQRAASKHVDLADHYAREQQERGTITVSYVGTKDMTADILTKALAFNDFKRHAEKLVHRVRL